MEGWIIIVTGLNEETTEDDLQDHFADYGSIKNVSIALNRRTGYVMVCDSSTYTLLASLQAEDAEETKTRVED